MRLSLSRGSNAQEQESSHQRRRAADLGAWKSDQVTTGTVRIPMLHKSAYPSAKGLLNQMLAILV